MTDYLSKEEPLKNRIQQILHNENLDIERAFISAITTELGIDSLTCAAALTYLTQDAKNTSPPESLGDQKTDNPLPEKKAPLGIKMVRYRLNVGIKHRVTLEQLKKVLVEESGVDKNNINNVNIQCLPIYFNI
jgi:hypothetical protein